VRHLQIFVMLLGPFSLLQCLLLFGTFCPLEKKFLKPLDEEGIIPLNHDSRPKCPKLCAKIGQQMTSRKCDPSFIDDFRRTSTIIDDIRRVL
jgi:hypothetical protein